MQKMPAPLRFIEPMECQETAKIPEGAEWQYELKLDGYRAIAIKESGELRLFSRNGKPFNAKFPGLLAPLLALRPKRFLIDGEIVALDENGRHSFSLLQRFGTTKAPLRFYIFDLMQIDTENLMTRPLSDRRARIEREFRVLADEVQLSPILPGNAATVLRQVREFEFEGVVAKRLDSIYRPGETPGTWQKQKTQRSEDFLIGGYIPGTLGIDELVVGEKTKGGFLYVESVRNGFVPATRRRVYDAIKGRGENVDCPFVNLPEKKGLHRMDSDKMKTVRWMNPKISCEIAFNERTEAGRLRHSKFLRLRDAADLRKWK